MSLASRWSLPLVLLLTAVSCKDKGAPAPGADSAGTASRGALIGAALSLTGAAASYGAQQRAGIQAAVDDLNQTGGVKLEGRNEDNASTKEEGITGFQKVINRDKRSAISRPPLP